MARAQPTDSRIIRVFLVDDHPIVLDGISRLIDRESDLEVCGTATCADEAYEPIKRLAPDVGVIDLGLGESNGMDLVRLLNDADLDVRLLVLSMYDEQLYAERAIQAGALGYIMKEEVSHRILAAVRRVAEGKHYLSEAMTESILERSAGGSPQHAAGTLTSLSNRELETLRLIGLAKSSKEIAEQMNLSVKTVENYKDRLKKKLGLRKAQDLARYAFDFSGNR